MKKCIVLFFVLSFMIIGCTRSSNVQEDLLKTENKKYDDFYEMKMNEFALSSSVKMETKEKEELQKAVKELQRDLVILLERDGNYVPGLLMKFNDRLVRMFGINARDLKKDIDFLDKRVKNFDRIEEKMAEFAK